jgi:hypothetical protein
MADDGWLVSIISGSVGVLGAIIGIFGQIIGFFIGILMEVIRGIRK